MSQNTDKSKLVLIADDSWVSRQFLKKLLKDNQYLNVIEANDGVDALNKIKENEPACILCDLLMPNMNGDEVLQSMNENKINIPIIILTADIQETTKARCLELGAFGFLNKPPNEAELIKKIEDALNL